MGDRLNVTNDLFVRDLPGGSGTMKPFSENLPDIFVTRAEKNLYITPPNSKLIIIAVLHEFRDFVRHPGNRL